MDQDILTKIGYILDIPTLAAYCRSSKNMNRATCDNFNFWRERLKQDFHLNIIPNDIIYFMFK